MKREQSRFNSTAVRVAGVVVDLNVNEGLSPGGASPGGPQRSRQHAGRLPGFQAAFGGARRRARGGPRRLKLTNLGVISHILGAI